MKILSLLALNLISINGREDSIFTFTKSIKVALVGDDLLHKVPLFEEFQANGDFEEIEVFNFAMENKTAIKTPNDEFSYVGSLNYIELLKSKPDVILLMFGIRDT